MQRYEFRVRYADTDQMGWAYYGNYLRWFEVGRAEMMRAQGRSYRQVEEEDGLLLPVLEAHCRYFKGARYDELIAIETGVLDLGRAHVRFGYRLLGEDRATVLAVGWTKHCFLDRDGRPRRASGPVAEHLAAAPPADDDLRARLAAD